MKKFITFALCFTLIICSLSMAVFATPKVYNVPKAATTPTIDGVINADEWANALVVEMKKGDSTLAVPAGTLEQFLGCKISFMWADEGIYFAAEVNDNTPATLVPAAGSGSYNTGDGVQFNMFPTTDTVSQAGDIFFFTYHPKADDGKPYVGEHFVYSDGATGQPVPEAKIASVVSADKYIVEGLIPTAGLAKSNVPMLVKSGSKLYWNNVIMEEGGGNGQGLICDGEWFAAAGSNEYNLVDTAAGIVPQEATAAPAADTAAPTAPQTGDTGLVSIIMLAALAAITFVAFKKKAVR